MNLKEINEQIKNMVSEKRYIHSKNVANCAAKISAIYNYDKDKAYLAGLVHDCAKNLSKEQVEYYVEKYDIVLDELEENNINLSHSIIGAYLVENELNIKDEDIISATNCHTTGKENMAMLDKIIYIADLIEEGRKFPGVEELRKLVFEGDLDKAILLSFNNTIKFVIDNDEPIHPRTIKARNYMLKYLNKI